MVKTRSKSRTRRLLPKLKKSLNTKKKYHYKLAYPPKKTPHGIK